MTEAGTQAALEKGLSTFFKMQSKMSTNNMMLFNAEGKIEKYNSPEHILKDFYGLRLEYYEKRRQHLIKQAEQQLQRISNKVRRGLYVWCIKTVGAGSWLLAEASSEPSHRVVQPKYLPLLSAGPVQRGVSASEPDFSIHERVSPPDMAQNHLSVAVQVKFILAVIEGSLKVSNRKKKDVEVDLEEQGFDRMPKADGNGKKVAAKGAGNEDDEEEEPSLAAASYDYLLSLSLIHI